MVASAFTVRGLVGLIAATGVGLQVVQREDMVPAYQYFTVWSATLIVLHVLSRYRVTLVGLAGGAGILLSACVYLTLILPINGMGTSATTVAANVVLHVILPLAVLAESRAATLSRADRVSAWRLLTFPATYLVFVAVVVATGRRPPYAFLDPGRVGVPAVVVSVLASGAVYLVAVAVLSKGRVRP